MNSRRILLFTFFTLLFLFYPGDSYYYNIFAYNSNSFDQRKELEKPQQLIFQDIPSIPQGSAPPVTAEGVYIVDYPSFTPIYEKNANMPLFPASTTKIITALVAYDLYKPDDVITIKHVLNEGQIMGLYEGEKITFENLLYGMLVHSGNDAAYAVADAYGFNNFIDLMNKKVESLHMTNTHFTNPAGLDDNTQLSTPKDLALASRELLKNKLLSKIVSIKEIIISDVDFKVFHTLSNVNKLLGEIQGIGGLKTGHTDNAGENLISFYKRDGHQYIIVILKSQDRFQDTTNVVKWIGENVTFKSMNIDTAQSTVQ